MFLFKLADIIQVPFGYLLNWLYQLTTNYGVALIIFSVLLKLILLPATAKGKKSTMKMSRLTPRIQAIQAKYADDQQKQAEATRALYKEEGVSMGGGCLWSMVPLLILIPLYAVIRQPITYILHEGAEVVEQIVSTIKAAVPESVFGNNQYYNELVAAPLIPQFKEELREIVSRPETLEGISFRFLGVDLAAVPQINIFKWEKYDWAHFGSLLFPLLSVGSQILSMQISKKLNNSVITNEKGVQDEEAAKNSQANQTGKMMTWMMPLMSLWIGFTVPGALSLYWFAQGVVTTAIDVVLTKRYRAIYDAEDAERLKKAMEQEALEEEKERLRAQRRAENPDGITKNTSKKKLQRKQQEEEAAAKAAAKLEYDIKKGNISEQPEQEEKTTMSGIPSRPYCKGRNYDPNRYANDSTEE